MPLTKMEHFLVLTDDIDKTKDFYCNALGLEIGFRPPIGFSGYWLYYDLPDATRKIILPARDDDDFDRKVDLGVFSFGKNDQITMGVKIRLFMVNGAIKVQVGEFPKRYSPDVIGTSLAKYKRYETVTSFPLLYFSHHVNIPEKYLNLTAYATDSWYEYVMDRKPADMTADWNKVNQDAADYHYLCRYADEYLAD